MAFTAQDIQKGIDFTGAISAAAGDHNSLVDLSAPIIESSGTEGKGLVLWSKDLAVDTPTVPDAATTTKWKRYLWIRVPNAGAASTVPFFYAWNDSATSVATYLKWQRIEVDLTAINTRIDDVEADLLVVETTANNAAATANSASLTASNALSVATSAQTTANTAASDAATALAAVNTPVTGAAAVASTAQTTATNANNTATSAAANIVTLQAAISSLQAEFISAEYALPGATGLIFEVNHSLTRTPRELRVVLVCKTPEYGFAVGDELDSQSVYGTEFAGFVRNNQFVVGANTTKVFLTYNRYTVPTLVAKAGPSTQVGLTESFWRVKVYAK